MSQSSVLGIKDRVNPDNLNDAIDQAIALELATIPTYLYTYYSINRAQDQDALLEKIEKDLPRRFGGKKREKIARELTMDVLLYAN